MVIFDSRSSLGLVRLRVKKASEELNHIFEALLKKVQEPGADSPFAEITDEDIDKLFANFKRKCEENLYTDGHEDLVYLAPNRWNLQKVEERFPEIRFSATREHT